jgi:hypothetical protein
MGLDCFALLAMTGKQAGNNGRGSRQLIIEIIMKEYKDGEQLLARHIPADEAWKDGLNFFSQEDEYVQVGSWGYNTGTALKPHVHNHVPREVTVTQEVLYVRRGSIKARIFGLQDQPIAEFNAIEGDVVILLRGGHGYDIIEDGTQVLEVKNGPYLGAEVDRRRI